MENRRWGLEIRPCTVSLSTPSVESARELTRRYQRGAGRVEEGALESR